MSVRLPNATNTLSLSLSHRLLSLDSWKKCDTYKFRFELYPLIHCAHVNSECGHCCVSYCGRKDFFLPLLLKMTNGQNKCFVFVCTVQIYLSCICTKCLYREQCNKIEIGINDYKQLTAGYIAFLSLSLLSIEVFALQSDRNSSRPPTSLRNASLFSHSPVALCSNIWGTKCAYGMQVSLQKQAVQSLECSYFIWMRFR